MEQKCQRHRVLTVHTVITCMFASYRLLGSDRCASEALTVEFILLRAMFLNELYTLLNIWQRDNSGSPHCGLLTWLAGAHYRFCVNIISKRDEPLTFQYNPWTEGPLGSVEPKNATSTIRVLVCKISVSLVWMRKPTYLLKFYIFYSMGWRTEPFCYFFYCLPIFAKCHSSTSKRYWHFCSVASTQVLMTHHLDKCSRISGKSAGCSLH